MLLRSRFISGYLHELRYWVEPRASLTNMIGTGVIVLTYHLFPADMKQAQEYSPPVAVGIDVAKSTLSVCVRFLDGTERALAIRNIETDISEKVLPVMKECTGKVVMESTGHYHFLVALLLTNAGHDVRVVNPILAKQYTSGNVRKVKTDPADARGLARMALVADNLPPAFSLGSEELFLRKKLAMLSTMSKHLQALKASIASVEDAQAILKQEDTGALQGLRETVKGVQKALVALERECVRDAQACGRVRDTIPLLVSIPGVSEFCATLALQWFRLTENATAKSWIAYAGLDVSSRESGTWKGRCKLMKRGNCFLRRRLYSAAWGAVMNDPDFKKYYDHLRTTEQRPYVEALTIIARKIVRTMYNVVKSNTAYDRSKFNHKYLSTPLSA